MLSKRKRFIKDGLIKTVDNLVIILNGIKEETIILDNYLFLFALKINFFLFFI